MGIVHCTSSGSAFLQPTTARTFRYHDWIEYCTRAPVRIMQMTRGHANHWTLQWLHWGHAVQRAQRMLNVIARQWWSGWCLNPIQLWHVYKLKHNYYCAVRALPKCRSPSGYLPSTSAVREGHHCALREEQSFFFTRPVAVSISNGERRKLDEKGTSAAWVP